MYGPLSLWRLYGDIPGEGADAYHRLVTEIDASAEARFWAIIEAAWDRVGPEVNWARLALASREPDTMGDTDLLESALGDFLECLTDKCADLSGDELAELDRVLERKLFDLDRADIHTVTDGSDDGFLYCRGFIVAMGRGFHRAVLRDPRMAVLDAECESMCYFFAWRYRDRYGDFPGTASGISRESGSNLNGWSSLSA